MLKLIGYQVCPFVQRVQLVLLEKKLDCETQYIDLKHKPQWFIRLSPLGKVPILETNHGVLFESAVICNYLDEIGKGELLPKNSFQRAQQCAWIEFGSELISAFYQVLVQEHKQAYNEKRHHLKQKLQFLEHQLTHQPYYAGTHYTMIDCAYAPLFIRIAMLEQMAPLHILEPFHRIKKWSSALLQRPSTSKVNNQELHKLLKQNYLGKPYYWLKNL